MSLIFVETCIFYYGSVGTVVSPNVDSRLRLAPNNSSAFPWIDGVAREYSLYLRYPYYKESKRITSTELIPITRREIEVFW